MTTSSIGGILRYRELIAVLAWKSIAVRYKQAYLGVGWTVAKPLMLVAVFTVVRSFVGIDTGGIPYPVMAFAALLPWTLFQDSASEGVGSVVANAHLIKKIYFPREIFPLTAVVTKLVEFCINFTILLGLMLIFGLWPTAQAFWVPLLAAYTLAVALMVAFIGAALNVQYRDVAAMLPVTMTLLLYLSPVIYPLSLVQEKLLTQQAAGDWSNTLYVLYTVNPLAGVIDAYQRVLLKGVPPDFGAILPGLLVTAVFLPIGYLFFKRAESYFADIV